MRLDTFFVQARKAATFTSEAAAFVTARENFRTASLHHFDTFLFTAYILEGFLVANRWLSERLPAEAALESLFTVLGFLTSHSCMVGLHVTVRAEILFAASAEHAISSLMLSSFS